MEQKLFSRVARVMFMPSQDLMLHTRQDGIDGFLRSVEGTVRLQLDGTHGCGKAAGLFVGCALAAFVQIAGHVGVATSGSVYYLKGGVGGDVVELSAAVDE